MLSLLQQLPTVARADLGAFLVAANDVPAVTVTGAVPPDAVIVTMLFLLSLFLVMFLLMLSLLQELLLLLLLL